MFRRWRERVRAGEARRFEHTCSARVDSADSGLYFDALLFYEWTVAVGAEERILHPDEVARSLLVGAVRAATERYPVLHVREAEWSANERLSKAIVTDDRLIVRGRVRLSVPVATEAQARARFLARERVHLEETEHTARLEVLRERLSAPGLGLVWWLDRHDPAWGTTNPKQWTRELIESYEELAAALRRDCAAVETDEGALLRARIEEALALAEDPGAAKRFASYLGDYLTHVVGRSPRT
ncbi:hypothetical protein [Nocardiopsis alborubida]|uniref:Uncharacterized protein n=1 Tax=Nocardiopsis alborubida TaxID=146802 RepID=A0A7X6RRI2_9ACTN|nr:hypothetical protein [Nocardiopsis alborubida]NKZ00016.1 hypothetical protein [Nocardiopsis alborubida]